MNGFAVRKRYGAHLHYDFHLEMERALESSAVQKEPQRLSFTLHGQELQGDWPLIRVSSPTRLLFDKNSGSETARLSRSPVAEY